MLQRMVVYGLAGAAVFVACVAVGAWHWGRSEAETVPGTVEQDAAAQSGGVTVSARRAVFSGTAVDLWLVVTFDAPGTQPAGIAPSDAQFAGMRALSAAVAEDGTVVLRFPALAEPGSRSVAALAISGVQVMRDGGVQRVPGTWSLDVRFPDGDDARAAAKVDALPPVMAEIAGRAVPITAYRTSSATVVHYVLPAGLVESSAPHLEANGQKLSARRSERDGNVSEVWFEATSGDSRLVLIFEGLSAVTGDSTLLSLSMEPYSPAEDEKASETSEEHALQWKKNTPGGPAVREVRWHRDLSGTTILVFVEGIWTPEAGGKPVVFGEGGESLFVRGVGNYPAWEGQGSRTKIEAELPGGRVPRELTILLSGATEPVPRAEVPLQSR